MRRHTLEPILNISAAPSAPSCFRTRRVACRVAAPWSQPVWRAERRHGCKNSDPKCLPFASSHRPYSKAAKQPPRPPSTSTTPTPRPTPPSGSSENDGKKNNKPRAFLLAAFTALITVTGTWYGASLKTEKRIHQRAEKRVTATPDERIAQLRAAREKLVGQREALREKIVSLERRDARADEEEDDEERNRGKRQGG